MLGAIKYNLRHLLDFSGRDARQTFWFYVLFLVLINFGVSILLAFPMAGSMIGTAVDAARAGASEDAMMAQMQAQMSGMMKSIVWASVVTNIVTTLLLVAAFVRRLHDSGKSGWWALLALAAQLAGIVISIQMLEVMQEVMAASANTADMQAMLDRQSEVGLYGLIGWIAPILIVVFGVMPSTDGPNPYGEEPVRF